MIFANRWRASKRGTFVSLSKKEKGETEKGKKGMILSSVTVDRGQKAIGPAG